MRYMLLIIAVAAASVYMIATSGIMQYHPVIINCDVSEISPDFTPEARQWCRNARKQQ